jgi:septation ring formation regulator EzrA
MGIDGCADEAGKQAAVANYCKGLEMEINSWKARLYDVLTAEPTGDMTDTINLLKSTMRELEAVAEQMQQTCPASLGEQEKMIGSKLENMRTHYTKALQVISPGWFGG